VLFATLSSIIPLLKNLKGNNVTNKGAMEIAEILRSNVTLMHLNVSRNWINKDRLMIILTPSRESKTLHTLGCVFNTLS